MSDNQIKAAEAILKIGSFSGSTTFSKVFGQTLKEGWDINDITSAAEYLEINGLITMIPTKNDGNQFRLTPKGEQFRKEGKSIVDFINEERQKKLKALEKEERDEYYKTLQVKDLEVKLNIMNVEQRAFWRAQRQKNVQTTLIAVIGIVLSIMSLLISSGFFDCSNY